MSTIQSKMDDRRFTLYGIDMACGNLRRRTQHWPGQRYIIIEAEKAWTEVPLSWRKPRVKSLLALSPTNGNPGSSS